MKNRIIRFPDTRVHDQDTGHWGRITREEGGFVTIDWNRPPYHTCPFRPGDRVQLEQAPEDQREVVLGTVWGYSSDLIVVVMWDRTSKPEQVSFDLLVLHASCPYQIGDPVRITSGFPMNVGDVGIVCDVHGVWIVVQRQGSTIKLETVATCLEPVYNYLLDMRGLSSEARVAHAIRKAESHIAEAMEEIQMARHAALARTTCGKVEDLFINLEEDNKP